MKSPFIFNVGWAVQAMFIVLRCLDKIEWSWFKVFIPLEIYIGIIFIYDARKLTQKWFGFGDQNEATSGFKILGFIFAMIGAIIL